MHELAVTQSVLDIALRRAAERNARRITDLYLVVGQWSSIVDDSVQFYWDIISEGTIAQGAVLHFRRVPAELTCLDCGQVYQPTSEELLCPQCASTRVRLRQGDELRLEAIDIE